MGQSTWGVHSKLFSKQQEITHTDIQDG